MIALAFSPLALASLELGPSVVSAGEREVLIGSFRLGGPDVPVSAPHAAAPLVEPAPGGWHTVVHRRSRLADDFNAKVGDRVFFAPGSSELGAKARSVLEAQARWLKRYPDARVTVEGHADEPGSRDLNQQVSAQRAEAVRRRLVEEGVEAHRIAVAPLGRDQPIAFCTEPDCQAQNRRAVTVISIADPSPVIVRSSQDQNR